MLLTSTKDLPAYPRKIISLVPSQTELLHYLGLQNEIIGITKFCVHPAEWFKNKIKIGGTKNVNIQKMKQLKPDLIIGNKEENVKEQVIALANEFAVWVTDVNNLEEAFVMMKDIGELTNKVNQACTLIANIRNEFLKIRVRTYPAKACYMIWRNPYMTIGGDTFINDIMKHCRLQNIFEDKRRYPTITLQQIKDRNCELVILSSEPYPFKENHIKEIQSHLAGVKIVLADGEMFSWYGSRLLFAPGYFNNLLKSF